MKNGECVNNNEDYGCQCKDGYREVDGECTGKGGIHLLVKVAYLFIHLKINFITDLISNSYQQFRILIPGHQSLSCIKYYAYIYQVTNSRAQ